MPANNEDLHGMVPDKCSVALLLLDVINDLEFPGADRLLEYALPMADRIAEFKRRAHEAGIPAIYVNDNYGRWQSDLNALITHCIEENTRGKPIVERLHPAKEDYFVLKPKHSGFFSTTLDVLLDYLGVKTVIVTGLAGNICVLFTANDAYMRDFNVIVPADCTASNDPKDNEYALKQIEVVLKGDIRPSTEIDLRELLEAAECSRTHPQDHNPGTRAQSR